MKFYYLNENRNKFCQDIQQDESSNSDTQSQQKIQNCDDLQQEQYSDVIIPQVNWDAIGSPIQIVATLQNAYQPITVTDPTLLWTIMTPGNYRLQRNPVLIVKKGIISFTAWTVATYPTNLYLTADGVQGYLDQYGKQTDRIAKYTLSQVFQNTGTTVTYDVIYELSQDAQVQIPPTITQIFLRVCFDDNTAAVTLPLPGGIGLSIQFQKYASMNRMRQEQK